MNKKSLNKPGLLKIGGVIALLGVAVVFFRMNSEASSLPDAPEDRELYLCPEDKTAFELTPRELYTASASFGGIRVGMAPCPACHKLIARRAERKKNGQVVALPKDDVEQVMERTMPSQR